MLHKLLFYASGLLLFCCTGQSQNAISDLFLISPSSAPPTVEAPYQSSEWRQDSTWSWHWNSTTLVWQKDRRTLRTLNGSGQLTNMLVINWNFTLSEWANLEKYSNEYYPDHTTPEYKFRMTWDASDAAWVETAHYFYQSDGKITEDETRAYDATTNSYTSGNQTTYSYYPGGLVELDKKLDPILLSWENFSRSTRTFDGQGNTTSALIELWIENTSSWMNIEYYSITYNSQDKMLEMLVSLWDPGISDWKNNAKMTYEYNASGWLIGNYMYSWDDLTLSWKDEGKVIYHYDENGHRTQGESFDWNDVTLTWENKIKEIYSYHTSGMPHETFRYEWISALNQFKEFEYTSLDDAGNETETYHKDIDYQTFEYFQGTRTLHQYADGLLTEVLSQTLEVPANTWAPAYKHTNTWDGNRNMTQELYQNYDVLLQDWKNSGKQDHFYSSYIGMEELPDLSDLCFFRNPVTPGETIRCSGLSPQTVYRLQLIDVNGRRVSDQTIPGNGTVVIPETLSAGSYILLVTGSNGTRVSGKMMVI